MELVKSFHDHMKASVRMDGELLEEFEVTNGLRQGYTMAPTLFNLYACVVAEKWVERVKEITDVGTLILCKQEQLIVSKDHQECQRSAATEGRVC